MLGQLAEYCNTQWLILNIILCKLRNLKDLLSLSPLIIFNNILSGILSIIAFYLTFYVTFVLHRVVLYSIGLHVPNCTIKFISFHYISKFLREGPMRPKGLKIEVRSADTEKVLGKVPIPPDRGLGERCKLPQRGPGPSPEK